MTFPVASGPLSGRQPNDQAAAVLAGEFRASQALSAAILTAAVIGPWRQIDFTAVKRSWPPLRDLITALVVSRYVSLWKEGVAYYRAARSLSAALGLPPELPAVPPALPSGLIRQTLDSTGPGAMLHAIKGGQTPARAADSAAVSLSGAASRLALAGGRQAVLTAVRNDKEVLGWQRVTSGNPCAFCAMLASRGPVYKSRESAGFEAHNHCMCVAMPVWTKEQANNTGFPALAAQWKQVTKGLSGADARRAWRRYWDNREPGGINVAA
jgi:hypothetical protein